MFDMGFEPQVRLRLYSCECLVRGCVSMHRIFGQICSQVFLNKGQKLLSSVADPYHFDPDPGCEKIRHGSGSRANFDTDLNPGKNDTDPDPTKKD